MIYVDTMEAEFGRMIMYHMFSDISIEELNWMADRIGVKRKWFQNKPGFPHYDICKSKKTLAIKYGAKKIIYGGLEWRHIVFKEMRKNLNQELNNA